MDVDTKENFETGDDTPVEWIPLAADDLDVFVLVLNLIGLEHSRNPHRRLSLGLRLLLLLQLLLLEVQLCIVSRELLELDQEVSESELEVVDIVGVLLKRHNEMLHLRSVERQRSSVSATQSPDDHIRTLEREGRRS